MNHLEEINNTLQARIDEYNIINAGRREMPAYKRKQLEAFTE